MVSALYSFVLFEGDGERGLELKAWGWVKGQYGRWAGIARSFGSDADVVFVYRKQEVQRKEEVNCWRSNCRCEDYSA